MGYYSRLTGRIDLDPWLDWSVVKDTRWTDEMNVRGFSFEIEEESWQLDGGTALIRKAVALVPDSQRRKMYYLEDDLQEVAEILVANGSTATGWLVRWGEVDTDVQRYAIADGKLTVESAVPAWPDGTLI